MPVPHNRNRRNEPDFVESARWEDNITEEEKKAREEFNQRKGQEQYYRAQYQKEKREEEERRRKANERSFRGSTNYPVQTPHLLARWEQEEHIKHYPDEERKFWCLACKKGLANFDSAVQHICSDAHEQNAKDAAA